MQTWRDEKEYIESVLSQVHWKAAHKLIESELSDHIADQREAFINEGKTEKEAAQLAIVEMGDSLEVGLAFDKVYRPKIDWLILTLTIGLLGFGLFAWIYCKEELAGRDILLLAIGGGILFAGCTCDYRSLFLHSFKLYLGFMLLFAGISLFAGSVNGRPVWPSFMGIVGIRELLLLFPILYSLIINQMRGKGIAGLVFCGFFAAVPFLWAISDYQAGAVIIPGIACFGMLLVAVAEGFFGSWKKLGYGILCTPFIFAIGLVAHLRYFFDRLTYGLNPWLDPTGNGYQGVMLQKALASTEWLGTADYTNYYQFTKYVPESKNYFILTALTQRLGFIIFLLAICAALLLICRCVLIIMKQKSAEGKLIAVGAVIVLGLSFLFGFLANAGILLIPSIKLPFIAYGKITTIFYLFYIAILLSVLRNTALATAKSKVQVIRKDWISIKGGVFSIRFKD